MITKELCARSFSVINSVALLCTAGYLFNVGSTYLKLSRVYYLKIFRPSIIQPQAAFAILFAIGLIFCGLFGLVTSIVSIRYIQKSYFIFMSGVIIVFGIYFITVIVLKQKSDYLISEVITNGVKSGNKELFDLQKELKCCGSEGAVDYIHNKAAIPRSCCPLDSNISCIKDMAYMGCSIKVYKHYDGFILDLSLLGSLVLLFLLLGLLGSRLLLKYVKLNLRHY